MAQKPTAEAGILYVVPTPVGNLDDMTVRAVNVLKEVDVILAEDTRTSGVLMKHFGKPAASIGFAIVVDNLLMALSRQKIEMEGEEGVTVITYRKENRIQAIQKAKELRAQGRNVALRPEKVTKVCEVEL